MEKIRCNGWALAGWIYLLATNTISDVVNGARTHGMNELKKMNEDKGMNEKPEELELGFQARIIQHCFYEKGLAKQIGGGIVLCLLLATLIWLANGISENRALLTWYSGAFIFLSALTAIAVQNYMMFAWIADLDPVDIEDGEKQAEEIVAHCKSRNRLFVKLSYVIYVAVLGLALGFDNQYKEYLQILTVYPILWLLPSFVILIHMIINTGHVVEIMRINNIAGKKQELLAAIDGRKIYSHQIVTMLEGLVSARMVCGYAIGACIVQFLISQAG